MSPTPSSSDALPNVDVPSGLPKNIHLIGLGGAGVSGAARILAARGHRVTGHDLSDSEMLRALNPLGIACSLGKSEALHLPPDAMLLGRSAAVPDSDPQVVEAKRRGIPVLKYAELLGQLLPPKLGLCVAGTHGKTTTSWMLWHALREVASELQSPAPGALVGGLNPSLADATTSPLGINAVAGEQGGAFCVEACEYDRSFHQLDPMGAIITNVEADHLDYFHNLETIERAFAIFAQRVHPRGLLVVSDSVPESVEFEAQSLVWRVGRELEIIPLENQNGLRRFRLRGPGWATPIIHLAVPGGYNVENAAVAVGLAIGNVITAKDAPARSEWPRIAAAAARGVETFQGAGRRFEYWSAQGERPLVHDYAHHPTEVRACLGAAEEAFEGAPRMVLFQPHQHSRTARFLDDFAAALAVADQVVIAPVYGARKHIDGLVFAGAEEMAATVNKLGGSACATSSLEEACALFAERLKSNGRAVGLILGAGDVEGVRDDLVNRMAVCSLS
jgi:UDP-N-acetylmuramate--alanine ligase